MRAVLFALLLLTLPTPILGDWIVTDQALSGIVALKMASKAGNEGSCSGIVINADAGYVLTAAHCTEDLESLTVNGHDADLVRRNAILDLAVLRTAFKKGKAVAIPLALVAPKAGDAVTILGHAFGSPDTIVRRGTLAHPREAQTGLTWVDATLIPGDSGGALLNAKGELIGVNVAVRWEFGGAAHMAMAVDFETVHDYVEQYLPAPKHTP